MEKYLAKVNFEQGEHQVDILREISEDEINFLSTLGEPVHKYYHLKEIYQMAIHTNQKKPKKCNGNNISWVSRTYRKG